MKHSNGPGGMHRDGGGSGWLIAGLLLIMVIAAAYVGH